MSISDPQNPYLPPGASATSPPIPPVVGPLGGGPAVAANPSIMGGLSNQGTYWMTHPQEAADAFLRAHQINPDQHTAMGDWMLQQVQGLLPALFSTYFGQQGQNPTDQLADPNQLLNSVFYGGTGIGANLQNYAGRAMNALTTNPIMQQNLGDAGVQKFLQTLNSLNTYGMNPYQGQAYGNAFDARMNQQRIAQRNQLFANQPVTSLWDFLNQQGQPGAGALGLPGQFPGPAAVPGR